MTDPGTTRPFSPAELDAIEDALEQLTSPSELGALPDGGDAIVRERLASYRAISRLSRDVLRSYEAPAHVLDRVVSLARESARESAALTQAPAAAAGQTAAPARASFWQRIRAAWTIPLLATAVAAAVVVVVAVPMTQRSAERAGDVVAANEPAARAEAAKPTSASAPAQDGEQRLALAEPESREQDPLGGVRGSAALEENSARQDAAEAVSDLDIEAQARRDERGRSAPTDDAIAEAPKSATKKAPKPVAKDDAPPSAPKSAGTKGAPGGAPPPATTTTPTKDEERKQDGDELARADALRRGGDCDAAVKLYESVRKSGARKQRAKALVGLALCAERKGERDRAADLLAQARADDAEIDAYYDSER